jgi:hypothetical protein
LSLSDIPEEVRGIVLEKIAVLLKKSVTQTCSELGTPTSTFIDILKQAEFHPNELWLLRRLAEDVGRRFMQV